MEQEKSCLNCKFFNRHYSTHSGRLRLAYCGNCLNIDLNVNTKKKYMLKVGINTKDCFCEKWALNDVIVVEKKEQYKSTLLRLAKQIEEIVEILHIQDEEE